MTAPLPGTASGQGFRTRVRHLGEPVALFFGRLGLTPNALTILGFLITVAGAALAAAGLWLAAGIVVFLGGAFDLFDGALARATGRASKAGAFLDSVFDRWGESVVYIGIVIGCLNAGFVVGAGLAAVAMSEAFLVSYVRARAQSLGFTCDSGLFARPERVVVTVIGLVFSGLFGGVVLYAVVFLLAVVTNLTALQRIREVWLQGRAQRLAIERETKARRAAPPQTP